MIHELEYVYSRQQQASDRMLQNQHLETQAEYTQISEAEIAILPKPTRTMFFDYGASTHVQRFSENCPNILTNLRKTFQTFLENIFKHFQHFEHFWNSN